MAQPFDPYYKWLGIPPEAQPPDRYRLLGIQRFESDADVISHAVDRQMAHVRTFQTGQHSAESQRLLNELAAARLCLLHPEKKAAYDATLRAEIPPVQPAPPGPPIPPAQPAPPVAAIQSPEAPLPLATPIVATVRPLQTVAAGELLTPDRLPSGPMSPGYAFRRRRQFPTVAVLLTLAAMTLVVLAVVLVKNRSTSRIAGNDQPDATGASREVPPAKTPGPTTSADPSKVSPEPGKVQPTENPPSPNDTKPGENPPPDGANGSGPNDPPQTGPQPPPKIEPAPGAEPSVTAPPAVAPDVKPTAESAVEAAVGPIAPPPKDTGASTDDPSPPAPAPGPMVSVTLPSGKTLDPSMFEVLPAELNTLAPKASAQANGNQRGIAPVYVGTQENGDPKAIAAHKAGKLSGMAVRFHENGNPKILANYVNANRQGVVRMWDESGKNLFWGQFAAGLKDGLIVVFDQDRPWYVREAARGDIKASYLVSYAGPTPTVVALGAASPSPNQSKQLTRAVELGTRIEEQLLSGENELKRELRSWYIDELEEARRKIVTDQAPAKRAAMIKRIAARQAAQDAAFKAIANKARRGGR
ncbi:MAG: toxin-antitoxin system YwqK family antitoxin [Pirellulales bacterium]